MTHQKTLAIRLTPKASSNRIGETRTLANGEEVLTIYVTAPADKNKANKAMLQLLAKHLNLPASQLTILQGHTHRNKLIGIT